MNETTDEALARLGEREAENADELAESEARMLGVVETALQHWREWWTDAPVRTQAVEARLNNKFVICFPLAAHAMNHVETALATRLRLPWVAKSCARIAFEHSLTAQWVLMTADGERRVKAGMEYANHTRFDRFVKGVRQLGSEDTAFADAAHGLADEELAALVGQLPDAAGPPPIEQMCSRFASGGAERLLYDVHRELSGAIHPSIGLLRAHLTFGATGQVPGLDSRGRGDARGVSTRDLAIAAIWALFAAEVCRAGQPNVAAVLTLGEGAMLPVDLRGSDQKAEAQPTGASAYWTRS